jgi:hypothetical protein
LIYNSSKDGLSIDFMCLTMINPTTCWFKIVELPTDAQERTVPPTGKGKKVTLNKKTKVAAWLGNLLRIPQNSAIIPIRDLLNSRIFIGI